MSGPLAATPERTREELIRMAACAIDDATSAILTDYIVREAAVAALVAVGLIEERVR